MLGAERRLADRQRALVERPRPRTTASDDDMAQVWDAARARDHVPARARWLGDERRLSLRTGATAFDDDTARVGFVTFVGFTCQ